MFKKIRTRIIVIYSALTLALGLFFFFFFNNLVLKTHLAIIERELDGKARVIEMIFQRTGTAPARGGPALLNMVENLSEMMAVRLSLIDYSGTVIADSEFDSRTLDSHRYRREVSQSLEKGTGSSLRYSSTARVDTLYFARRSGNYIIRLAKPLHEIEESEKTTRRVILIFTSMLLGGALLITIIASRLITAPIGRTIDFAEGFAAGDFSRRIRDYSDDEIGTLQKSLNYLADSLQEQVNSLILERRRLEVTIQSIADGIAVIGTDSRIMLCNGSMARLLGCAGSMEGKRHYEAIRNSELNARIEKTLGTGEPAVFDLELLDGRTCDVNISPIAGEKTLRGVLIVLHDITEAKRIVQMKSDLVGNLSHELKTPITILRGYLETLLERLDNPDEARGFIDKALLNVERQNTIINDMLKLNMIETSSAFPVEDLPLREIIENTIGLLGPKLAEKRITVSSIPEALPVSMRGNRFLAEEIFFNLIDNAINYNRYDGTITIEASLQPASVDVVITDSGIGIPPDCVERIFERFYRVSKGRSRASGGTGLGLSIVKHAADIMQWRIGVRSCEGNTAFTVSIPLTFKAV